jgi:hypothetical protein
VTVRRIAHRRPRWGRAVLAGLALLTVACAGGPAATPDVREQAAPLLAAHAALEELAGQVERDPVAAVGRWPEQDERVQAALDAVDPRRSALATEERSLLVGYGGGLALARDAWAEVVQALDQGADPGAARQRAATRMASLERLRVGLLARG